MNGFISPVYWLSVSFEISFWKIYDVCIYVSWGVLGTNLNTARATGTRTPSKSSERWMASFATMDVDARIARNCFLWACLPLADKLKKADRLCHHEHVQLWIVWLTPTFFLSLSQQLMKFNHFVCLLLRDIIWFVEVITVHLEVLISSFHSCDNDCKSSERCFCCFGFLL